MIHTIHYYPFLHFENITGGLGHPSGQEEYLAGRELVVKASGLAAGKGVLMPQSMAEAKEAVEEVMATWMERDGLSLPMGYIKII